MLEWAKDTSLRLLSVGLVSAASEHSVRLFPKQHPRRKISGVYEHHILHPHALLTRGFDDLSWPALTLC
ncbi:homoserine O-succinyltransferase [Klebsiella pneumoniae]|nr:homoserine O-succinyltransferase [Klebsiella pneumoniae]